MKKSYFIAPLLILWSIVCHGQAPSESSVADTLDAVSVIDFAVHSLSPVHSLSGESLKRLSSNSVADAIRYFSGVQVKDYGGIGGLKTVNVRSLGAQHVGIFYDGVKIENAQNGQVDLGRFSLENMEEVSVYNAQKSEYLQSASDFASASSVYLKTRRPTFDGKRTNFHAGVKYGSFMTVNPSARYEHDFGPVSLTADGMYLHSDGDYRFRICNEYEDTVARRANGDMDAVRGELGLFAKPLGGDLQAHAYFYSSERGLPGPVIRRISEQYATIDRQWDRDAFLQASWKKTGEHLAVLLNTKASREMLRYKSDPDQNPAAVLIENKYLQRSFYLSGASAWYPNKYVSINLAVDGRLSDLDCDVVNFNYVRRGDLKSALAISANKGGFSAQGSLLHTYIRDFTEGSAEPLSRITPALLVGWKKDDFTIRAFYKSIFRAPTLNDLYYTHVGNVKLKPEYTKQLDLGCDMLLFSNELISSKITADVYANKIEDKIVAMPVRSQFRWSMCNFGLVKGYGADLSSDNHMTLGKIQTSLLLTYSYERAKDCSDADSHWYEGQIPYIPWHSASAVLGMSMDQWTANLSCLYTGRRYRASDNIADNLLKPWTTLDASVSYKLETFGTESIIGIDINNLLNQHYEVVSRYPMPGINALLKIQINI